MATQELLREHPVMRLLADGVPLTLLADLLTCNPPDFRRVYRSEGGDTTWVSPAA